MPIIIISFLAGLLTLAAPCILPLLPIVIGGSIAPTKTKKAERFRAPVIAASLGISVILFTLALKASAALLSVPAELWQWFSAAVLITLGLSYLVPSLWERLNSKIKLNQKSNASLSKSIQKEGLFGAVATGTALGPVFNSCSPTYAFIVAVAIPASFLTGLIYLIAYALGLSLGLLALSYLGKSFQSKLKAASNPNGYLKKGLGIIFITVGLSVAFGLDKKAQTYIIQKGWYAPISELEGKLK